MSAHDGEIPGDGIFFYFTSEVCPTFPLEFKGFTMYIDSSTVDKDGKSPVFYQNMATTQDAELVGHVPLRSSDKTLSLHISRRENHIVVDASNDMRYDRVFEKDDNELIDYGYFTVAARTEARHTDAHDLVSVRVYPMPQRGGESGAPDSSIDWSAKNRKVIENEKRQRKSKKERRRKAMPSVFKMFNKSVDHGKQLDGSDTNLRDALTIISEAQARMSQGVSVNTLQRFIETIVDYAVDSADRKMMMAASRFDETSEELNVLWAQLRSKLLTLAISTAQDMTTMKEEFEGIVKHMKLDELDTGKANSQLSGSVTSVDESMVTLILSVIALVECVCYVIFFCVKRAKTDNFKKLD